MEIDISNQIRIKVKNQKIIEVLKQRLTKVNPQYHKLKAMNKPVFGIDKDIKMFEIDDDWFIIPRGTGKLARNIAKMYLEKVTSLVDNRCHGREIDVELNFNEDFDKLFTYQEGLIQTFNSIHNGVAVMPPGSGKTVSALGLISEKKLSTLIIVHTSELLEQWKDEISGNKAKNIEAKLRGDFILGQLGCGKKKIGDITVATVQTLSKLKDKDFEYLNKQFGIIIQDECHHCPATTFLNTIKRLKAKYLYGLSATPKRKDQKEFALYNYIGPIVYTITDKELENFGRSVPVKVQYVTTNLKINFKQINEDWVALTRIIATDIKRNYLIMETAIKDVENDRFPMILCHRKKHALFLKQKLEARGYRTGLLISDVSKDKRNDYKRLALQGELDIFVCMDKIAGEGLDIPVLDTIHLTFPINNESNLKQYIGRIRRVYKDKLFGLVYIYKDYIYKIKLNHDFEHKLGIKIFENQNRWFKRWGLEVKK